jgi:succinate dehydrogenase/fumarate reductase flavoprotein subunit
MAFANFMKSLGKVIVPPKRIREWRKLKRQYRAYLQGLPNINPKDVRRGVREWMEKNPKPKRTGKEKEDIRQILSEIPQRVEETVETFGNGGNGVQSTTFTGQTTLPRKAGFNPLLLLLLIPLLIPNLLKKF